MAYADDQLLYRGEPDLITVIDEGVRRLRLSTGKTFNNKLKDLSRSRDSFVPTVFELLVLITAARHIMDYEPTISTGVPEARITLAGENALIEARAKMEHSRGSGAFNPSHMGHTLAGKAREKYAGQLSGATEPVILFMSLDAHVVQDIEPEAMLAELLQDPASRVLSAIIFSETYRAKHLKLWRHPGAHRPLTDAMLDQLSLLFCLSEMIPSGHYLPKK